jgi:hypothetical protein
MELDHEAKGLEPAEVWVKVAEVEAKGEVLEQAPEATVYARTAGREKPINWVAHATNSAAPSVERL